MPTEFPPNKIQTRTGQHQTGRDYGKVRLGLPSKGRMEKETFDFLADCGLQVAKHNSRQYVASIPAIPELEVWLQRSPDIVRKVRFGDVDLGVTGFDSVVEHGHKDPAIVTLHNALGFGKCQLVLAIPDNWDQIDSIRDLSTMAGQRADQGRALRVGTKYERTVSQFLDASGITPYQVIRAEGALEAGPHMGYVDLIADLVSTGVTLRENHLKQISDGTLVHSESCLIGNRYALKQRPEVLAVAKQLLEFFEAHIRAVGFHAVLANIEGETAEIVAQKIHSQPDLRGLRGPTVSPIYPQDTQARSWYAVNIIVRKERLVQAVEQLRAIGGSGVVVMPATYIFEDEPATFRKLMHELQGAPE